jgi:formylglycine-generating enzyme required for sulfatase activity
MQLTNTPQPTFTPTVQPTNTPQLTFTPTVRPTNTPTNLPSRITDDHGVPVVLVPAGAFEMGGDADIALAECQKLFIGGDCQRDWFTDEERIHTVTLEDYYIDQYEVTNARYKACVDAGVCDPPGEVSSYTRSSYYGNSQYDDYPVIYVSWDDAKAYCEWRGARLPTEAEWEKAARGGLEGKLYPWGDGFDGSRANFCDRNCTYNWANKDYNDGYADTAPVGSYAPNGYGLYDMAGNVWEWVADWYDGGYYGVSPSNNPTGPSTGEYRVLRGGSWHYIGVSLRVATRLRYDPSNRFNGIGFRCALSP